MKEKNSQKITKVTRTNWVFLRRKKFLALLLCMAVLSTILPDTFTAYAAETVSSFTQTKPGLTISWKENAAWGGSISAEILLKNNSSQDIENWQLSFDWAPNIGSLWCAAYEAEPSRDGQSNHYTIIPYEYNCTIAPEGELAVGFIASGEENTLKEPESYSLAIGEKTYTYNTKDDSIIETTKEPVSTEAPTEAPAPTTEPILTEEPAPTTEPVITEEPTEEPTIEPEATATPAIAESPEPTKEPTEAPTEEPTIEPEPTATPEPTPTPTPEPTIRPTPAPTEEPLPNPNNWEFTDDLIITQNTILTKNTSCRNLIIRSGCLNTDGYELKVRGKAQQESGNLCINGGTVEIEGDYHLTGNGCLEMLNKAPHLLVKGDFQNDSTGETWLNSGTIEVKGDVFIENPRWVYWADDPVIKLSGSDTQTVDARDCYLYNLDITESAGVDFRTDIWSRTFRGTEKIVSEEVCFLVENFTLEKDTVIPCDVIYRRGYWNTQKYRLKIQGDLTHENGGICVNGGSLEIEGDYCFTGYAYLQLLNEAPYVLVKGDFENDSAGESWLYPGTIEVQGDVSIENPNWVYWADNPLIKLSGSGTQTVDAKDCYLYNLDITESAGVDFRTDIWSRTFRGTENIVSEEVCFRVENFTLEEDTVIPCDVIYRWGNWNTKKYRLKIQGDLTHESGGICVNGGSLEIEGDYCFTGYAYLQLLNEAPYVLVKGDFENDSAGESWLCSGTIEVQGDVSIENPRWVYWADNPLIKLSGSTIQYVDARDCYFYNLDITESKGVKFSHTVNAATLYGTEKLRNNFNYLRVNRAEISEDGIIRGNLHMYSGVLDINGHECTIRGSLCMENGSISTVKKESRLTIRDEVKLEGGCMDIGEGNVHIKDDLDVRGTATIAMKEVSSILDIDGSFRNSSTQDSQMEAGTIYLGGSLIQKRESHHGSMRMNFLVMDGEEGQNIKIEYAAPSAIRMLSMRDAKAVNIQGTVFINYVYGWDKIVSDEVFLGGWNQKFASTAPIRYRGTLHLMVSNIDLSGGALTLGGLDVYESLITVGDGELIVNGDFTMQGETLLDMTAAGGIVTVKGNLTTLSFTSHVGHLTNGVLHLYGNLSQGGYSFSFAPSDNFKLNFVYQPGVIQEVFLSDPSESRIPEENRYISHPEAVIFNADEDLHVTAETLYDHFYAGVIEEISRAEEHPIRYITTETLYNLSGEVGVSIGLKISRVDGKVIFEKMIASYGMAAVIGTSIIVMVTSLLCTSMWSNIGNPNQAAKETGRTFTNMILSGVIELVEKAALSMAKSLGTFVGGVILNADEIGEILLKQIDFDKLLHELADSICDNFKKFQSGISDIGSYLRHDLLSGILPDSRTAVEKLQKYLTESAGQYLEKEVAAGNLTEEMLEKVSSFLSRHTGITELSEAQLRLCTLYDGSEGFLKKVLWAGENEGLLAKVSGEGIDHLYHRFVKEIEEQEAKELKELERLIQREVEKASDDLIGTDKLRILEENAGTVAERGKDVWWNTRKIEPSLPEGSKPSGVSISIEESDLPIIRQKESADLFASKGYKVENLKEVDGGNGYGLKKETNPDYLIEDKVFDCYAPKGNSPKNVTTEIRKKTIEQTPNIVLNLDDYKGDTEELLELIKRKATSKGDLKRLEELWIIKDKEFQKLF